jgi:aldehyde dehydrogenase (NAD+)
MRTNLHCPDYILIQKDMKDKFIGYMKEEVTAAYSNNPKNLLILPVINVKNWNRLKEMIDNDKVIFGGQTDESDCYIAPPLSMTLRYLFMKDEIFGPYYLLLNTPVMQIYIP